MYKLKYYTCCFLPIFIILDRTLTVKIRILKQTRNLVCQTTTQYNKWNKMDINRQHERGITHHNITWTDVRSLGTIYPSPTATHLSLDNLIFSTAVGTGEIHKPSSC
ncbi:unnamed protein product [Trichobilharzia szidati]|nr:unnamed protein product [Trichobilharzia szidati]